MFAQLGDLDRQLHTPRSPELLQVRDTIRDLGSRNADEIRDGHGLANVRRRLEAVYRGAGRLDLGPNPEGRGARARLDLPLAPSRR